MEDLKDAVMEDMQDIFSSVDKTGEGRLFSTACLCLEEATPACMVMYGAPGGYGMLGTASTGRQVYLP